MIYKNLVRFVKYLLTINVARLALVLFTIFAKNDMFGPQQILFTGLVVDLLAMIVITFEHPNNKLMLKNNTTEELFGVHKYLPLALLSGMVCAVSVAAIPLLIGYFKISAAPAQATAMFVGFIFAQIAVMNELLNDGSIFRHSVRFNRAHFILGLAMVAFMACTYFIQPFAGMFGIVKIGWIELLISLMPAVVILLVYEIRKMISGQ